MKVYGVANVDVTNPEGFARYREAAGPSVAKCGGRYLVRGGRTEVLDGDVELKSLAMLEFPNLEAAKRWYNSPEYQAARPDRLRNSIGSLFLVEGTD